VPHEGEDEAAQADQEDPHDRDRGQRGNMSRITLGGDGYGCAWVAACVPEGDLDVIACLGGGAVPRSRLWVQGGRLGGIQPANEGEGGDFVHFLHFLLGGGFHGAPKTLFRA